MPNQTKIVKKHSHHILPTSANLLGFTFIVLTSIKSLGLSQYGITDEVTGVCVLLFALSSLLSFMSIRGNEKSTKTYYFEKLAQAIFFTALLLCLILALLLASNTVKLGK